MLLLKADEPLKTIPLENEQTFILLEENPIAFRHCRLCDIILSDAIPADLHVKSLTHKKIKEELGVKDQDEL
jgi:hypothetical protein